MRVVIIVSDVTKSLQLEWTARALKEKQIEQHFILLGVSNSPFRKFLESHQIPVVELKCGSKLDYLPCFLKLISLLRKWRPQVVHTHLLKANFLGLSAAWLLRIPKRFVTRHHTAFHHDYHPSAVKWDKLTNGMATHLIAPCKKAEEVLIAWEGVPQEKVFCVPHGFDLSVFENVNPSDVDMLRARYSMGGDRIVVGVISRYSEFKGIQFMLPAFRKFSQAYPSAHLVLANADGDYKQEIRKQLALLEPGTFTEIRFEENVPALYRLFDLFVHVPVSPFSEAFGQTYVEALASGIPSVFTLSGIACEFVVPDGNAVVVPFCQPEPIYESMVRLTEDAMLRKNLVKAGLQSVRQFDISTMANSLSKLYLDS